MRTTWNGIAATRLVGPDGATAIVADHGAHVLSWKPAGESEALFLSERSQYGGKDSIRGGVPIIFPQFSDRGAGVRHGFARRHSWRLKHENSTTEEAAAFYVLTHLDVTDNHWPHEFQMEYKVAVRDDTLVLSLQVCNTSKYEWAFQAALHTYFRVADTTTLALHGLMGMLFLERGKEERAQVQKEERLRFHGEVDHIYVNSPERISIVDDERLVKVVQTGFRDTVVWNPGPVKAEKLTDLKPGD